MCFTMNLNSESAEILCGMLRFTVNPRYELTRNASSGTGHLCTHQVPLNALPFSPLTLAGGREEQESDLSQNGPQYKP
jgi:hypothetical protein